MREIDVGKLMTICRERNWMVGFAESCTGGLLSAWVSAEPGVSACFSGSVVSYSRKVKIGVLNVPKSLIEVHGEVSIPVARSMAQGVKKALACDWAVSITGVAGPSGGTPEKPVGTVCFAVVGPGVESYVQKQFESKAKGGELRQEIQRQAALFAFDFLLTEMR